SRCGRWRRRWRRRFHWAWSWDFLWLHGPAWYRHRVGTPSQGCRVGARARNAQGIAQAYRELQAGDWPSAHGSATVPETTPITSHAYAMRKTHRKGLFQFVAATALAGVSSLTLAADNIRIALAGPVRDAVAQYGDLQFTGVNVTIDMATEAGGVDGRQLEGVVFDDACDPSQAVVVANRSVIEGISVAVAHLCSISTQPATDIYEDEG